MVEKGIDIFSELESIQTTNISRAGKEQQKLLGKMTIQGFLEQKALREDLARRIALSHMGNSNNNNINISNNINASSLNKSKGNAVSEEMTKLLDERNIFGEQQVKALMKDSERNKELKEESFNKAKEFKHYIKIFQKQHKELLKEQNNPHLYNNNHKYNNKHKKLYFVNQELIEQLKSQRNKSPESYMYNPNYNSICKHIPQVKLQPLKIKHNNHHSSELLTPKDNDDSNVQSLVSCSVNDNISCRGRNRVYNVIPFEKYSSRQDIVPKHLRRDKSVLEPYKYKNKKYIAGPNFKKMLSRNKSVFNSLARVDSLMDYSPNYDALYSKIKKNFDRKEVERGMKRNLIKKIWASFDVSVDYIVVPKLNKHKYV